MAQRTNKWKNLVTTPSNTMQFNDKRRVFENTNDNMCQHIRCKKIIATFCVKQQLCRILGLCVAIYAANSTRALCR